MSNREGKQAGTKLQTPNSDVAAELDNLSNRGYIKAKSPKYSEKNRMEKFGKREKD